MNTNSARLILASSSPRRSELLQQLNLSFEVRPSHSDETISASTPPPEYVRTLAIRKTLAVAKEMVGEQENSETPSSPTYVIGADTIVSIDGHILGKPRDEKEAKSMLRLLQGRTHTVYTGLCVWSLQAQAKVAGFSATEVTMRPLSSERIQQYLDTGEPFGKAGAYAIQGYGSTLITRIQGDYFTVVGLPLFLLYDYLNHYEVSIY